MLIEPCSQVSGRRVSGRCIAGHRRASVPGHKIRRSRIGWALTGRDPGRRGTGYRSPAQRTGRRRLLQVATRRACRETARVTGIPGILRKALARTGLGTRCGSGGGGNVRCRSMRGVGVAALTMSPGGTAAESRERRSSRNYTANPFCLARLAHDFRPTPNRFPPLAPHRSRALISSTQTSRKDHWWSRALPVDPVTVHLGPSSPDR